MSRSGWSMKKIGDLFDVQLGKMLNEKAKQGDLLPYLANFNVRWGAFDLSRLNKMAFSEQEQQKYSLSSSDLLICEGGEIGRCAVWEGSDVPIFYQKALHRLRPLDGNIQTQFISYYMQHMASKGELHKLVGETSIAHFTKEKLLGLYVPVPPIAEQTAIVDRISTWDKAIELKEALINEKNQQKKWLMQNLLTGKKRLLGFTDEWQEIQLGEIGDTYSGLSGKSKKDFGYGSHYVPYTNIFENSVVDIDQLELVNILENESQNKVRYGDIFFTTSSEKPDEVGMSSVFLGNIDDVYLNSFCIGLRPKDFNIIIPEFAGYFFRGSYLRSILNVLAQGATRYNLSRSSLVKISVKLPAKTEQTAIAEIISTADREIELQEKQLEELKKQKKALMQLLLTGMVRVNTQEVF